MSRFLVAVQIVDAVLANFKDRRGFRHLLESIELEDEDTFNDIRNTLTQDIFKILKKEDM
jgi:hypothetical protein